MMSRAHADEADKFARRLIEFHKNVHPLKGLTSNERIETFVKQIISSIRRIEYVRGLDRRNISASRADPTSDMFCPLRAAIIYRNKGNMDEAMWLIFLATHFGKHASDGWRLMKDVYGAFGERPMWTWKAISADKDAFADWAKADLTRLLSDRVQRRFSNHRKYESKKPKAIVSTLLAYVNLVEEYGNHRDWLLAAHKAKGQNPTETFQYLYESLGRAERMGRLGRFDFLTMVGKLDLMPVVPGIAYLKGATGPLNGARLLIEGDANSSVSPTKLEAVIQKLDNVLNVGMQVLEDSMCNWQKSPNEYVYFRG